MWLSRLVQPLQQRRQIGSGDPDVTSISYDSREAKPGGLFVAFKGQRFDGHGFIADAVGRGAVAVVADDAAAIERLCPDVPVVLVPDSRRAMPVLAATFYDHPSRRLKLVGVTGTKGKTTTTYLIEGALRHSGLLAGVVGTLGARIGGRSVPLDRTTPESVDLQDLLAQMVSAGAYAAAMEVSSHALAMRRTEGCEYDAGVFTNLTHDHLDFHGSLEEYLQTKLTLFSEYPRSSGKKFTAVVNADDPACERVREAVCGDVITYGIRNPADLQAESVSADATGVAFRLVSQAGRMQVRLSLGGMFNVYNSLAATGAALALGLEMTNVIAGLESVSAVDGRFESVDCGQDFAVIVDYAHSPDSLDSVLKSARELTDGRLICLFGCGGDRDRMKRPVMGRIAAELADICIVTSDNPRSEEPAEIIAEILEGMNGTQTAVEAIADRRDAIRYALDAAQPGDLVLIAGKGHETYQIFRDQTIHFDDREVARELLSGKKAG